MRRTLSTLFAAIVLAGVPLVSAGTSAADDDLSVFSARAESSAAKVVAATPMELAPSLGYALSEADSTPKSHGIASIVEPGLVGRAAAYIFFKMIDIPLSAECFYPDPPGPVERNSSAGDMGKGTGAGLAMCRSDERPGNYTHSSVADTVLEGGLSLAEVAATSRTGRDDAGLIAASSSTSLKGILVGDVLQIEKLQSTTSAAAGRTSGSEVASAAISVVGAAVQGQRVAITEQGPVVLEPLPGLSPEEAQAQVNEALSDAGVTVRLLSAEIHQGDEPGRARARSGGVVISWRNPEAQKTLSVVLGVSESVVAYHQSRS